jgi:hypothetical protein
MKNRRADDPMRGLAQLIEAAISLGAREHNLLTAARSAGSLTPDISTSLYEALNELAERAQEAGLVRADLAADDLPRLIAMLHSVLFTMDSGSDGWRRYVALMLDAITDMTASLCPPRLPFVSPLPRAVGRCEGSSRARPVHRRQTALGRRWSAAPATSRPASGTPPADAC